MCGITGFINENEINWDNKVYWMDNLKKMTRTITHRGPDESGVYLKNSVGLGHRRLSVIDLVGGKQPMEAMVGGKRYVIVYNGECYNTKELKNRLEKKGYHFKTLCDTEVLLASYIVNGPDFIKDVNGIFAFGIWDESKEEFYMYRDRQGVKPFFYTVYHNNLVFGSELKALFQYPGIEPELDKRGLNEIFSLGPAKSYGYGVFKGIMEVLPGHMMRFKKGKLDDFVYWSLKSAYHEDSYEETVEKTKTLVQDAIRRQMVSDVPICTFLSGGLDSSIVSAVCARELQKKGEKLSTFSFDFIGNEQYFQANKYQSSEDRPYVNICIDALKTDHRYLECGNTTMLDYLYNAVDARDLPCMADVESSLLYFCKKVKKYNKVALTGECADEIFGGYPWFTQKEAFEADAFPWAKNMSTRKVMLDDDFANFLEMEDYAKNAYSKTIMETPVLVGEKPEEARRRELCYLNLKWFMQTLLDRMDRTSSYCGLEARVPIADHRIVEYVFNVPWDMKCRNGLKKSLLRETAKDLLPYEVLYRKKSPYPKTYDPNYEKMLAKRLEYMMEDSSAPIKQFINKQKVYEFIKSPKDYGRPWYGQLMAGPQMMAYILQVNYWLEKYKIKISL